jgi:hypothetical protein
VDETSWMDFHRIASSSKSGTPIISEKQFGEHTCLLVRFLIWRQLDLGRCSSRANETKILERFSKLHLLG